MSIQHNFSYVEMNSCFELVQSTGDQISPTMQYVHILKWETNDLSLPSVCRFLVAIPLLGKKQ